MLLLIKYICFHPEHFSVSLKEHPGLAKQTPWISTEVIRADMHNISRLSHFSTHWILVANLINTVWLFQMVTWQVTAKIKCSGILWHIPVFCLPHFQHTLHCSVFLLLYLPPYSSPLANTVPLLPSFWENYWDTKNLVALQAQCISLFSLHFSIYWLCSTLCPFTFCILSHLSHLQYYLLLTLPVGFSCSPHKLIHHPLVQCSSGGYS